MPARLTLQHAQETAQKMGGTCLSSEYKNTLCKLEWECSKEHTWSATYASVKSGKWCLICSGNAKHSIRDAKLIAKNNHGYCLSECYKNNKALLLWKCSKGHIWEASYNRVSNGHWCPTCGGTKRHSIQYVQKTAKQNGGSCLSRTYKNSRTPMLWMCSEGHKWNTPLGNIQQGSWCPQCAGVEKLSIEHAQQLAEKNNGKCLSEHYVNNREKLQWQCLEGHIWEATYNNIQGGHWCPSCGGTRRLTIEDMHEAAKKQGGSCLSLEYVNGTTPLEWECSKGHQWETPYLGIINKGAWCPECGIDKLHDPRKYTIQDMHDHAAFKGGKCLSSTYVHTMSHLLWECSCGNQWMAMPTCIIHAGSWCNVCCLKYRKTESRCRDMLEQMTGLKFPATRKVLPGRYELDMYNVDHNLAFEYDGEQHFRFVPQWHKNAAGLKKQQDRDKKKDTMCKDMKINLERIHYSIAKKDETLESFFKERLKHYGLLD